MNLQVFKNADFGTVRTVIIDNEPWFVGKDIAGALGYAKERNAIALHVDADDRKDAPIQGNLGGKQKMTVINESGMYALIFGSKLASAKKFKHWVTSEVLPAIRKTGTYSTKKPSALELLKLQSEALFEVSERVDKLENTMTIDYAQQQVLGNLVSKVVINALGGKDSNAYICIGKSVFAECNRDIKHHFKVNSRNNIAVVDFENAKLFIVDWQPCHETKLRIKDFNEE